MVQQVCVLCSAFMPGAHAGQKGVADSPELELQKVLSQDVGAGN